MQRILRRFEKKDMINLIEQWMTSETLVNDCESAWLDRSWDEYMKKWEE